MKKTFITIALMLGLTATASAATVTGEATPDGTAIDGYYTIRGFTMDFGANANYEINNEAVTAPTVSALTDVNLTSVDVSFAAGADNIYLSIYEVTSSAASDKKSWSLSYCGTSSNSGPTAAGSHTFTFSPITFDTSKTYAFFYTQNTYVTVGSDSSLTISDDVKNANTMQSAWDVSWGKKTEVYGSLSESNSFTFSNSNYGVNNNTTAISTFNFTGTQNTAAIPEPTTATLSLLALAGLAARRRRK